MGTKGGVDAPDFGQLANQMGMVSRNNVIEQLFGNRPNINTPFGSVSWDRPNYPGNPYANQYPGGGGTGGGTGGDGGGGIFDYQGGGEWGRTYPTNAVEPYSGGMANAQKPIGTDVPTPTTTDPAGTHPAPPPDLDGRGGDGVGYDPNDWQMNLTLPPEVQAALESQQRLGRQRSEFGEQMMGNAQEDIGRNQYWDELQPYSYDTRQRAEDAIYQRAASRLDPRFQQEQDQLQTRLANMGLSSPTNAANQGAWDTFNRGKTDAYQTAMNEAIMGGGQEYARQQQMDQARRQQQVQEGTQRQYQGMNAMNAFLGGQQVGMPGMPSFMGSGVGATPDYLGAGMNQYNAGLNSYAQQQAQLQNLFSGMGAFLPFMV